MPSTALIVVDMVHTYEFEDAEAVARNVEEIVAPLKALIERGRDEAEHVIYVNDNFGEWLSEREQLVENALSGRFAHLVEEVVPDEESLFIVKTRHSIFFGTPLEYVLREKGIDRLVLAGQVTEQCILYSALDAHMRRFPVVVARDCVAQIDDELGEAALKMMERNMEAEICASADVSFSP